MSRPLLRHVRCIALSGGQRDLRQRTFGFACRIVTLCRRLSAQSGINRQFAFQLVRCGTSIGANLEEAKSAHSRRDFACKLGIVLRESRETHYWLRLLAASGLAPGEDVEPLVQEADELVAIFTAAVKKARQKPDGTTDC